VEGGVNNEPKAAATDPAAPAGSDLDLVRGQFEDFCEATGDMRKLAKKCRDYKDGAQYTGKERETLEKRKQPCITDNKIIDKVNSMMGLEQQQRTDPKAYPRTPKHEQAAEAATDALRYVADNCDYQRSARKPACENLIVEGWCYGEVCIEKSTNEIIMDHVRVDRGYHDIRSLRPDFEDKEYCGYFTWMDAETARRTWSGKDAIIDGSFVDMAIGEKEHEDKPNRYIELRSGRKRLQVFTHYFKKSGEWHFARWCKGGFLEDPKPSPYKDENGKPACNIEVQALYRDSDGNCYGAVQRDLDLQDEHNKRRSKLMHLLNTKRIFARKGTVQDMKKFRAELHKPDGVPEYEGSSDDLKIEDNFREAEGQWRLLQYTDQQLSMSAPTPTLVNPSGSSGRAKEIDQAAGILPLMPLFDALDAWEIRMYRLAWLCVRQFWRAPMWIRVTDNEESLRFVGLNQPTTVGKKLAQQANDDPEFRRASPEQQRAMIEQIAQHPQAMQQMLDNNVAEMDVDIIISRSADTVNIQAEQFDILARISEKRPEIPFSVLVEMSQLRSDVKRLVRDSISGENDPAAQQQAQFQQMMQQLQLLITQATARKTNAEADKAEAGAEKDRAAAAESQIDASVKVATFTTPQAEPGVKASAGKTQVSVN